MNRKQKICLWVGIVAIVVMGLFPPWVFLYGEKAYAGPYGWIGTSPSWLGSGTKCNFVDLHRLGIQYFVVAVVTSGLIITLKDKKDPKQ